MLQFSPQALLHQLGRRGLEGCGGGSALKQALPLPLQGGDSLLGPLHLICGNVQLRAQASLMTNQQSSQKACSTTRISTHKHTRCFKKLLFGQAKGNICNGAPGPITMMLWCVMLRLTALSTLRGCSGYIALERQDLPCTPKLITSWHASTLLYFFLTGLCRTKGMQSQCTNAVRRLGSNTTTTQTFFTLCRLDQ